MKDSHAEVVLVYEELRLRSSGRLAMHGETRTCDQVWMAQFLTQDQKETALWLIRATLRTP